MIQSMDRVLNNQFNAIKHYEMLSDITLNIKHTRPHIKAQSMRYDALIKAGMDKNFAHKEVYGNTIASFFNPS